MTGTILRVSGSTKSARSFLASTHWQPCATFVRGEPRGFGSVRKHLVSGFNLTVSNASSLQVPAQVRAATKFLRKEQAELARLRSLGLSAVLDFGVASNPEAMVACFRFPVELLASMADAAIGLEVSHYGVQER